MKRSSSFRLDPEKCSISFVEICSTWEKRSYWSLSFLFKVAIFRSFIFSWPDLENGEHQLLLLFKQLFALSGVVTQSCYFLFQIYFHCSAFCLYERFSLNNECIVWDFGWGSTLSVNKFFIYLYIYFAKFESALLSIGGNNTLEKILSMFY